MAALFKNNPHFLRTNLDKILFFIFLLGGHLSIWYELFHVLPYYHENISPIVVCHFVAVAFLYMNIYGNLFMMIKHKPFKPYAQIRDFHRPDWRYCVSCQGYFPLRSHHCRACDVCVLQRDHHCWFAGVCVGHDNHRYYLAMLFYTWIGALYGNAFHAQFVLERLWGLGPSTVFCILLPHVASLFGFLSLYQFFIATMSCVAFTCLLMFSWMFVRQFAQLRFGQTEYERKKGLLEYDKGWKSNFEAVCGRNWRLILLAPWISSPLPGDGIHFEKQYKMR